MVHVPSQGYHEFGRESQHRRSRKSKSRSFKWVHRYASRLSLPQKIVRTYAGTVRQAVAVHMLPFKM
eukprot:2388787-Karenia_brevis.AAC.1